MEKMNFPEMEEKILKFWEENKIFEKSLEIRKKSPRFVFFEGPPYANGKPGIHHVLGRVFKDLFCRYKTMRGFLVERKAGWDTHGLPVEVQTEKELGFKTKKEIENYGIEKFNQKCRENVWKHKDEWDAITKRIGFWLDLEHPYITYENDYIESLWWIIKQIYDKGLLVQDYRVAPYCPRCGTTLSSHELAQGYKKVKEKSIYVKFKAKSGQKIGDFTTDNNTYFLVWTTTPWTLPGNVALAVNPDIDYVLAEVFKGTEIMSIGESNPFIDKEIPSGNYMIAKNRWEEIVKKEVRGHIIKEFKGKDLLGWEYEPLYDFVKPDKSANSAGRPAYRVVSGDFVSTEEGTGIVHIAPAFGEDDMRVGKENDLPVLMTVDKEGRFIDEIKSWKKEFVKLKDGNDVNPKIVEELDKRGLIYKTEKYEHDYPFCWRCESPLLYYALTSWFIKMTEIKEKLIENNEKVNWFPEYLKDGRFGEWLKEVKDWNFSRERYWGVPLPIWKCEKCEKVKVIGSMKELEDLGGKKIKDLHRPYVDEIVFDCEKCGGEMRRVPEVADIWFDSGAMPFAQWHYPFENKNFIDKGEKFPAELICEGMDQTRGWFYTLLAVSTLLGLEAPYKNVVSYGLVLDKHGKKMSKSKGNAVDVRNIIDKFGVDALRWYFYTVNAAGMPTRFDENDVQRVFRRFIMTLWNTFSFWKMYSHGKYRQKTEIKSSGILDGWIFSELNMLIKNTSYELDNYDLVGAARKMEVFLDDLSNWYLRLSRNRLKEKDNKEVYNIFSFILVNFVKLLAPFIPFMSDHIFKEMTGEESAHLEEFPQGGVIDKELLEKMEDIRKIASIGLELRAKAGIKVRQPLKQLAINMKFDDEFLDLLKNELNIREIIFNKEVVAENGWLSAENGNFKVSLDTEITGELKKEGILREIIRNIQSLRKKAGLTPKDKIVLYLHSNDEQINGLIEKHKETIKKDTILSDIIFEHEGDFKASEEIVIDGKRLFIGIK